MNNTLQKTSGLIAAAVVCGECISKQVTIVILNPTTPSEDSNLTAVVIKQLTFSV